MLWKRLSARTQADLTVEMVVRGGCRWQRGLIEKWLATRPLRAYSLQVNSFAEYPHSPTDGIWFTAFRAVGWEVKMQGERDAGSVLSQRAGYNRTGSF